MSQGVGHPWFDSFHIVHRNDAFDALRIDRKFLTAQTERQVLSRTKLSRLHTTLIVSLDLRLRTPHRRNYCVATPHNG